MLSCIRKKLPVTAIPAKTMELAQTKSTNITAAVHQDFTGHSVKRLKACLVHQVCRDVHRILMTMTPGRGHCVVFLGKTLYSHSASLYPGVQMVPANVLGVTL